MKDFKNKKEDVIVEELSFDDISENEVVEEEIKKPKTGKVIKGSLNLRVYPSKEADILHIFPEGRLLFILNESDGWYEVYGEGKENIIGWVMAEFVEIEED